MVEKRTINEYHLLREQAFNVGCWRAGGEIRLETHDDEMERFRKQVAYARKKGCLGKRSKIS